ncbi:ADP-ribosylglycohydrolase family protein [Cryptosporangium phraense]|uniref:ADP-ribosylglycohydrolase family protein n=2 Tax=Cryptosporangium phraense TaxID=2593070 RepID=A0A545AU76_9ACTN|nr:ADP-ribosylglycohydrolase family protein [Cryptosporangium phraense]
MPTQNRPRAWILARYGKALDDLHPGPDENEISRGLPAGRVTDDTDQAVIVGSLFAAGDGSVDPPALASALLDWEDRMRSAGSLDLLGPSTRRALAAISAGVPAEEAGRTGDTNGAAMRIAPIGVGVPVEPLDRLVDAVEDASRATHHTGIAIAGAAAVAAAVSAGVAGWGMAESLDAAVAAARLGAERGHYVAGADVAARITWARDLVDSAGEPLDAVAGLVGTGLATQESVPAALAVAALFPDSVWDATRHAAALGGDTDTIAAMAGAVVGAHTGLGAVPPRILGRLHAANPGLALTTLADRLLALRDRRAART